MNLAFSEWVQVSGDEKLTMALLDRIVETVIFWLTKASLIDEEPK